MVANARAGKFRNKSNTTQTDLYDSEEGRIVEDDSGDMGMSNLSATPSQRAGVAAMKTAASGGSTEDVISGGLMATGNPYAIGAAAGIQVLSASKKREQANRELQYQAKLERISRQQRALENMTGVAQSLRNL